MWPPCRSLLFPNPYFRYRAPSVTKSIPSRSVLMVAVCAAGHLAQWPETALGEALICMSTIVARQGVSRQRRIGAVVAIRVCDSLSVPRRGRSRSRYFTACQAFVERSHGRRHRLDEHLPIRARRGLRSSAHTVAISSRPARISSMAFCNGVIP
jgi:hypothetical protein